MDEAVVSVVSHPCVGMRMAVISRMKGRMEGKGLERHIPLLSVYRGV